MANASMKIKINKTGLKKLLAISQKRLVKFAENAVTIASAEAPYISGHLSRNILWEELLKGKGVIIFTRTGYGGWVEMGTAHFEGRRFLAKGVDLAKKEILE